MAGMVVELTLECVSSPRACPIGQWNSAGLLTLVALMPFDRGSVGLSQLRHIAHVWNHVQPLRPPHSWTECEGIFFSIRSPPCGSLAW